MSNLQVKCCLKIDFQKVDQHARGMAFEGQFYLPFFDFWSHLWKTHDYPTCYALHEDNNES